MGVSDILHNQFSAQGEVLNEICRTDLIEITSDYYKYMNPKISEIDNKIQNCEKNNNDYQNKEFEIAEINNKIMEQNKKINQSEKKLRELKTELESKEKNNV